MEKESSTIDKFIDPSQWMVWKFQVRVNLMASELVEYINGTKVEPAEAAAVTYAADVANWRKNDAKAQKVIVNSCGSNILIHLCNCTTSKQMWDKLHSVYEQSNEAAKQLLQEQYHLYKKNPAHDIATHISTLQGMVQKLAAVKVTIDDNGLIMKILMTLPAEYRHFLSAWDSVAPAEKIVTNLTNRLMVEESRCGLQSMNLNEVSKSEALLAKQSIGSKKKSQPAHKKKQRGKCFRCGSTEHYKRDCKAAVSADKSKTSSSYSNDGEKGFLGTTESSKQSDDFYHDSGATSHMCKQREHFQDYVNLEPPINVKLGDGKYMQAIGRGNLQAMFYDGKQWNLKTMHDVLYAPNLAMNLFSSTRSWAHK